ncbi:MAG: methyltransferase domain-containing protein [Candidatus Nezhaarchaeota archaeon]|nr:methyltransferase domain-containing protein [Candidatus Nezhaarchaeota archaeon]
MARRVSTPKYYDELSRSYSELYGPEQLRKHTLALSLVETSRGAVILDVGCGDGSLISMAAGKCSLAVGVDSSRRMVKLAWRRLKRRACLVLADAESLPFRDGSFDAAFVITVLQNLSSPRRGLSEVRRVLKGGGVCVATWLKKAKLKHSFEGLLRGAGLRPIKLLDLEGVQDLMSLSIKEEFEPKAYLRRIRNVRRGLELRSLIIKMLRGESLTIRKLAEKAGCSYSSAFRQVKNLEREGIVERLDNRPAKWKLTGRGQACIRDYLDTLSAGP